MNHDHTKIVGDVLSAAVVAGTLVKWLPAAAALLSIIWTGMRIFDWVENRLEKRRAKAGR